MLPEQYEDFYRRVMERSPSRLLVWGLGHDSALTAELNAGGETLFLSRAAQLGHAQLAQPTHTSDGRPMSRRSWALPPPHGRTFFSSLMDWRYRPACAKPSRATVGAGTRSWWTRPTAISADQAPPSEHRGGLCPSTQRACTARGATLPCLYTTACERSSDRCRAGSSARRVPCCRRACGGCCVAAATSSRRRWEVTIPSQRACADTGNDQQTF